MDSTLGSAHTHLVRARPTSIDTFKSIVYCGATAEYQLGRTNKQQYVSRLASDFALPERDVQGSLQVNKPVTSSLQALKSQLGDRVKIFAVTNMSHDDFALVKALDIEWSIFEGIFVSCQLGMRKPELRFYQAILDAIGLPVERAISVDDDTDNTLTALSMGMRGILCSGSSVCSELSKILRRCDSERKDRNMIHALDAQQDQRSIARKAFAADQIGKANAFLRSNARNFPSLTHTGVPAKGSFAQLLILELTGDRSLVDVRVHPTTWNYFIGKPVLTQAKFPDDMDTTSLGITILRRPRKMANAVMDKMLQYQTADGLMQG